MTFFFPDETALRAEIVKTGQLLYERGLVIAGDGNISARLDEARVLCTPSGLCKGMMTPDQLVVIDMQGRRADVPTPGNKTLKPTSEMAMHLEVYRQRPDVRAVVHAHPPYTITLSIADISLAECMLPEAVVNLGIIRTTPYSTPGSPENAAAIRDVIGGHNAIVLQRHGSLTVGQSPLEAFFRTETLEQIARITYLLKPVGGGTPIPPHQVKKLLEQRRALGYALPGEDEEFYRECGACSPAN
jgi:L-fuculose-phosphate aldolase